jgi:hypothetical protein
MALSYLVGGVKHHSAFRLRTTILDDHSQAVTLPNKLITDLIMINFGRKTNRVCFCCLRRTASRHAPQMPQLTSTDGVYFAVLSLQSLWDKGAADFGMPPHVLTVLV